MLHASFQPAANPPREGVIAAHWPTLARAMSNYTQETAAQFSAMAYDAVSEGLIRLDDRQRLAAAAKDLGIKDFDAQLLIACAVRKWSLDHHYDPTPTPDAPALSLEYKSYKRMMLRAALFLSLAALIDLILIIKWLL
jgi:hypothetical protein